MPVEPRDLWSALCADLRNAILAELAAALQEVSDDLGTCHGATPELPGCHLHSTVEPASSPDEPGKLAAAVCAASARSRSRVA